MNNSSRCSALLHQRLRKKLGSPKSAADSSSKRSSSSSRAADGRVACEINTRHLLPTARRAWRCSTSCRRERWSSTKIAAPTRQTSSALEVVQPVRDGLSRAGSELNFRLTTWMNLKDLVNPAQDHVLHEAPWTECLVPRRKNKCPDRSPMTELVGASASPSRARRIHHPELRKTTSCANQEQ